MPTLLKSNRRHGAMTMAVCAALTFVVSPLHGQTPTAPAATGAQPVAARITAQLLLRVPDYVEFPASVSERAEVEVCVLRPSPVGAALQALLAAQNPNGRAYKVRELDRQDAIDTCRVLYVPAAASAVARPILRRAAMLPILTVGDYPEFLEQGGIINLRLVDRTFRYDVARTAGEKVGLRFRSQVLQYAASVT